ncbi:homocysteine S-methyltransferase family protein [Vibrio sp. SS-MA-C1-2]|uniref:homocysteine S-methyltransferase family protein n=1 Tax=Vibrio sp. SS-MA-C1-2 TaxID=2908646 RepID=UPI001F15E3B2|nr:homocysteine S-methyltransferase family protein [Vibrio sp. SS-MA-C1-2]UJF17989.1 homocysteine S-methyltransferase family protein [Vibrio sp. SS-MA-C1-2]
MDNIVILDGGMGRELKRIGAPFQQPEWSALALMEDDQYVTDAHNNFLNAGASVITVNTYALVPFHIGDACFEQQGEVLIQQATRLAKQAARPFSATVAGCIPPVLGSYRTDFFEGEKATPIINKLIENQQQDVDLWLLETISSLDEAKLIVELIEQNTAESNNKVKPIWLSLSVKDQVSDNPELRSGEKVRDIIEDIISLPIAGILFNCSCVDVIEGALKEAKKGLDLAINNNNKEKHSIVLGAYANGFAPLSENHLANSGCAAMRDNLLPEVYADYAQTWIDAGATLIGGCCGIHPEHIAELVNRFTPHTQSALNINNQEKSEAVCL